MALKQVLFATSRRTVVTVAVAAAVVAIGTTAALAGPSIVGAVTDTPATGMAPHRTAASVSLPAIPTATLIPTPTTTSAAPTTTVAPAPAPAPAPAVMHTTTATSRTYTAPKPAPAPAPVPQPAPAPVPTTQVTNQMTIVNSSCSGPTGGPWQISFTARFSDGKELTFPIADSPTPAISYWDTNYGGQTRFWIANPNHGPVYQFPC